MAPIAREVADVLTEKGYKVLVQDYDIPLGASFVDAMHEAIINSRDLIILFTEDYLRSPYTRKEFTSFEAERVKTSEERHIIVLRCEDVPLRGLLADNVYQTLVGIENPDERKRRIIAAAERQSQAAPPPPRPFIGVPPRIASFTGRAEELDRLDAILMRDKPVAVTQASVGRAAVQGMGGVGKTSLAVEYAYRYRNLYAGVCWCTAETRAGLLNSLAGLGVALGAVGSSETEVERAATITLRRLNEQRATWLLVYDNVTAPDQISDLLPSAGARVLITSRFSDWSELADEVAVDVLPPGEAVAFLENRTRRGDAAGARTLAGAVGNLPLALDHAAAYCKRTQMGFADYAAKALTLIAAAPRGTGYPRSVAATFDLAIAEAVAQCQSAEALIVFLAQCAPERIPMILVEGAIADEAERLEALAALAEVSLVKHDPFEDGTPAVTVHRLVQAVAARSEAKGSARDALGQLIARLVVVYPKDADDLRSWFLCAQLTPHLLAQRAASLDDAPVFTAWPELLSRAGGYFQGRAAYSQALPLLRDALAIREKSLGPEHPDTVGSLSDLASVLRAQGDFAAARPLCERALVICEKALGPEHIVKTIDSFAPLLQEQGDFAGAQSLYERALTIREKLFDPEHPEVVGNLVGLAYCLQAQANFGAARPLYEHALAISEKALGGEHPGMALVLNNFALMLLTQSDFTGARPLLERALAIDEKLLGSEHPNTAKTLGNLSLLLFHQGDSAGARPLSERALAMYEKALGPEHPDTAGGLNNLAKLLETRGDFAGARPLYERALAIYEKTVGPEHANTAKSLNNLSLVLFHQGDHAGARPLLERAVAISEKAFGPDHPDTAVGLQNLAFLFQAQSNFTGARPLYERALAIYENALGVDHPDTATILDNLACVLRAQGDFAGARPLCDRAVAVREKALARSIPTRQLASRTSLSCFKPRATWRGRGRCSSGCWRCGRERSAPSIPIRRLA